MRLGQKQGALRHQLAKSMDFTSKNQNFVKKIIPNTMFFSIGFFYWFWEGFGRILERFLERFGASGRLWGHFLASFSGACIQNALQKGSWRLLGSIWASFWRVWEGSGKDFGKVCGELRGNLEGQKFDFSDRVFWFRILVAKGFGPKAMCLKISCIAKDGMRYMI